MNQIYGKKIEQAMVIKKKYKFIGLSNLIKY